MKPQYAWVQIWSWWLRVTLRDVLAFDRNPEIKVRRAWKQCPKICQFGWKMTPPHLHLIFKVNCPLSTDVLTLSDWHNAVIHAITLKSPQFSGVISVINVKRVQFSLFQPSRKVFADSEKTAARSAAKFSNSYVYVTLTSTVTGCFTTKKFWKSMERK